jgi:radial spoke head protein 4A
MYQVKKEMNDDLKYSDLFEDISIRIKKNGEYFQNKIIPTQAPPDSKIKELLSPLTRSEGEGAEKVPVSNINYVPDYVDLFNKFSFCGISLGTKENLLLTNSLRNLSSTVGNGNVSFFGKIYGTEKDYYIAEGTEIDPPSDANYDNDMEKRKEDGFNRNVFFVTNNLCEKWVELPDVKPKQIILSRQIRYMFT